MSDPGCTRTSTIEVTAAEWQESDLDFVKEIVGMNSYPDDVAIVADDAPDEMYVVAVKSESARIVDTYWGNCVEHRSGGERVTGVCRYCARYNIYSSQSSGDQSYYGNGMHIQYTNDTLITIERLIALKPNGLRPTCRVSCKFPVSLVWKTYRGDIILHIDGRLFNEFVLPDLIRADRFRPIDAVLMEAESRVDESLEESRKEVGNLAHCVISFKYDVGTIRRYGYIYKKRKPDGDLLYYDMGLEQEPGVMGEDALILVRAVKPGGSETLIFRALSYE